MKIGIILAGGKGKRFDSTSVNKTAIEFSGKPMVLYGVELFEQVCDHVYIVVGHAEESVKSVLSDKKNITYVRQEDPKGTGDAVKIAVQKIKEDGLNVDQIFVGYGDHMMFYDQEVLNNMIDLHNKTSAKITMVTTNHPEPNLLSWGRIVRDKDGRVQKIVEQKDASETEKSITELNAGLYCFDYKFVSQEVFNLTPSPVTNEFYLTDLVDIAIKSGYAVSGHKVPFEKVGIGINTKLQKDESEKLFYKVSKTKN